MPHTRKEITVGMQAHHLTVMEPPYIERTPSGNAVWWVKVQCDCPQRTVKPLRVTDFGATRSCGCRKGRRGPREIKNKTEPGSVFGRLTVIEEIRIEGRRIARCRCSCEAQTVKDVPPGHLHSGAVRSCGCLNREVARQRMQSREAPSGAKHPGYKHGLALKGNKHPHYARWVSMMARCYDTNDPGYDNYGAVGVSVHEPWHDVAVFCRELDELLGPCPAGQSLDRIDVFGRYEPGNLRWATSEWQSANRRNSRIQLNRMARRVVEALRAREPGHSVEWYITFIERAALAASGFEELPDLPPA